MNRITIHLTDELMAAVKRDARRRRISQAAVIRDAIQTAVGGERPRPRGGLYASGAPVARRVDGPIQGFGER